MTYASIFTTMARSVVARAATAQAQGNTYHADAHLGAIEPRVYPPFRKKLAPKLQRLDQLAVAQDGRIVAVGPRWWDRIGDEVQQLVEEARDSGTEPTVNNIVMLVLEQELPSGAGFNPVAAQGSALLRDELITRVTKYLENS
jgi:hypothetical protein